MTDIRTANDVIKSYSEMADEYDSFENLHSCWGTSTEHALGKIEIKNRYKVILDVGCGTGHALREFASKNTSNVQFIGVEPADKMRKRAENLLKEFQYIRVQNGCFEDLKMEANSVDYLYSVMAFHWTTDVDGSIKELRRVLKSDGEMDLFFVGRNTGREFTRKTTPVFMKYMEPALLLQSAGMRKHLTKDTALEHFSQYFNVEHLAVNESFETYYDNLERHWIGWRARAAGHFARISAEKREECDQEIRQAISSLGKENEIPYTVHLLHVKVRI